MEPQPPGYQYQPTVQHTMEPQPPGYQYQPTVQHQPQVLSPQVLQHQPQVLSPQISQQQVNVIVNQPQQPQQQGPYPQNVRDFSSGICGCCEDCCSCLYAWFCMPCFKCTLADNLNECYCGPFCFDKIFLVPMRTKLRTMFGIRGTICDDFLCMTFCEFCAVTQMMRELKR